MEKDYVWCNKDRKQLTLKDINNTYLYNIMCLLNKGGGYIDEIDENKITKLFNELNTRKIKHKFKLEEILERYNERIEQVDELTINSVFDINISHNYVFDNDLR